MSDAQLRRATNATALEIALALTGSFLVAEVVGGILIGSLALISDAAHMLTDTVGLAIALTAKKIAQRPADSRRTFGYQRFEILAATFNAIILFVVAGYILLEGYSRLKEPPEIQSLAMLGVAALGLAVNLLAMRLLEAGKDSSLNAKGAYLEVWSDMLGSIGVIAAALFIWLTGLVWVDALVAIAIGLWVLPRTWGLLKETLNVLLDGVPEGIDVEAVASALKLLSGVQDIHDLHIWALTSDSPSLSAHVVLSREADSDRVREAAAAVLRQQFQITHVTLQMESRDCRRQSTEHDLH